MPGGSQHAAEDLTSWRPAALDCSTEDVLELQRLAGNRATADAVRRSATRLRDGMDAGGEVKAAADGVVAPKCEATVVLESDFPTSRESTTATGLQLQKAPAAPPMKGATRPGGGGSTWTAIAGQAKAALKRGDSSAAERLYRGALVVAAAAAAFPTGMAVHKPVASDIQLDLQMSARGETRPAAIPGNEDSYWRWIFFGRGILMETQAFTEAVISHELVHVRQYQQMWEAYKQDRSPDKGSWAEYRKRFSAREQVLGPAELEAEKTGLGFLARGRPEEQAILLRGLFVAYVHSTAYTPPAGESTPISATAVRPLILECYRTAESSLQVRMGAASWWALMDADFEKGVVRRVLVDLGPIVSKGYGDTTYRSVYDRFLADKGLKISGR